MSFSDSLREFNRRVEHGDFGVSEMYHLEYVRLSTFSKIPPNQIRNVSCIRLAGAGFYYRNSLLRCFSCDYSFSSSHTLPIDDDPVNLHHLLNPNCEFLQTISRNLTSYSLRIPRSTQNDSDHLQRQETIIKEGTSTQRGVDEDESGYQSTSERYQHSAQRQRSDKGSQQTTSRGHPMTIAEQILSLERVSEEQEKQIQDKNSQINELIAVNQVLQADIESLVESSQCVVCILNARIMLFCPCRHVVCCKECYSRLCEDTTNTQPKCPTCRRAIQMFWP